MLNQSFPALLSDYLKLDLAWQGLLRGLDYNTVQTSFAVFRQSLVHFPFVALRSDADAVNMETTRPMLTLAICVVTSGTERDFQLRLGQAFRLTLSSKAIVEGERSLDLMLGLLVYLAWHHRYMSKQQIYQELCLLAGMATDLGLYQSKQRKDSEDAHMAMERDRAFCGCYYICCSLSIMGFNKPNPLRWTDNLRLCAEHVGRRGTQPSDRRLSATMELSHAMGDMEDALQIQADLRRGIFVHYVNMQIKAINSRLKTLKRQYSELGGTLGFAATTIHLHHRLLKASETPDMSALVMCACQIKDYMDDLLSRPAITLHQIAIVDWTNLLEILVLMARISRPLPQTAGWESGALTFMLQPDNLLDAIANHMASAPANNHLAPRDETLLQWFRGVCESVKRLILHERGANGTSASTLRNDESQYDTVHSLGQAAEARFRPVNGHSNLPPPASAVLDAETSGLDFDAFDLFGGNVLDEAFWNSLMIAT